MKADEIRGLSDDELRARVAELQEEQFRLRFRGATETLEQPLRLRTVRRDIARCLTLLRQRELAAAGGERPTRVTRAKRTARSAATAVKAAKAAKAARQQGAKRGAGAKPGAKTATKATSKATPQATR